jgi:hypothetical protein
MSKLRLLLSSQCSRSCPGCCNNDWDLTSLPEWDGDLYDREGRPWDEIILTGGEPMLDPLLIARVCDHIEYQNRDVLYPIRVYLYTAKSKRALDLIAMLNWVDGITLTLHNQKDVAGFVKLQEYIGLLPDDDFGYGIGTSFRLNVFAEVDLTGVDVSCWKVRSGMKWVKDCPLPKDEVFMRLNHDIIHVEGEV